MHSHSSPTAHTQPTPAATQPEHTGKDASVQEPEPGMYIHPLETLALSSGDGTIQRKLSVGSADDELEQQADHMADTVMRKAQTPFVQRKCADCEKEEQVQRKPITPFIQKKGGEPTTASTAVSSQIQSSRGSGSSLPAATQGLMESSFGADFSGVKIHTDSQAAGLSQQLQAQAFTVGSDIYFNQGKYNPESQAGRHLLAHELTHTLQQKSSIQTNHIQRQEEVSEHYMSGFTYSTPIKTDAYADTSSSSQVSGNNYWHAKLTSLYEWDKNWVLNTPPFTMGASEWNAILSKAWDLKPATVPTAANAGPFTVSALVPVTPPMPSNPHRVQCRFTYRYDTALNKPVFKLEVLRFIAVTAAPVDANQAPRVIKKSQEIQKRLDEASHTGFPGNSLSSYFTKHPEVKETLAGYIQAKFETFKKSKQASDFRLNELVKIKEVNDTTETPLLLHLLVNGSRDAGVYWIELVYSKEQSNTLSADYNQKDYADFRIEKDQQAHPTDPKMGQIKGLDAITNTDERRIVKNLAVDFFTNETDKAGVKTRTFRDMEIDQIVPLSPLPTDPAKTSFLYYTFIVHKPDANNLVTITVKKIGQKGDAVVGDPDKGVIARIPGYAENAYDAKQAETPANLITWLLGRYKGVKKADIDAPTVADVTSKMNAIIETQAGTTDWFKNNYSIKVLDAADAKTRLNTVHKRPLKIPDPTAAPGTKASDIENPELAGLKDYTAAELKFLELSLQKFSVPLLKQLQGMQMIRQNKDLADKLAGLTLHSGYTYNSATKVINESTLKRSIIMYDSAFADKGSFLGGTEGVNPAATSSITHELGHAIGHRKSVMKHGVPSHQDKFNDFYKVLSLTPVTAYAKDTSEPASHSPDTEYFPEALMLFLTDPQWLLHNQYQTYFWFLYLYEKGLPPSQDQAKSISSVWEAMKALPGSNTLAEAASVYVMWKAYAAQKAKVPDAAATTTLVAIAAAFLAVQTRRMRDSEATAIVKKWLAFKSKNAPTTDEIKTFLP